jgi:predicted RNA-binding Zn-ribbon protein involved in translation (DUF1610 family)
VLGTVRFERLRLKPPRPAIQPRYHGPRILCWNCKELTPFQEDRCQACGAPFAGGTGGAYQSGGASRPVHHAAKTGPPVSKDLSDARRSLRQLFDDLQRVHDVASSVHDLGEETTVTLFQCPSCGRFVSEASTACACGVRFSSENLSDLMYMCPKCGSEVSADDIRCSCGAIFEA